MEKVRYLYILQCRDGTLYTGITDDIDRRMTQHNAGKGAKYTRGRGPVTLRYREKCQSHSHALKREIEIKKLTRAQKQALLESFDRNSIAKSL